VGGRYSRGVLAARAGVGAAWQPPPCRAVWQRGRGAGDAPDLRAAGRTPRRFYRSGFSQ